MADSSYDQQLANFMAGIRAEESGGNYGIKPYAGHPVSGAYQFSPGTWQGAAGPYAKIYPEAWMAPPQIQDEVARQLMGSYFRTFGGDWRLVAKAWIGGPGNVMKNLSDGNTTEDAYAANVLRLAGLSGAAPTGTVAGQEPAYSAQVAPSSASTATGTPSDVTNYHSVDLQAQTILGLLSSPAPPSIVEGQPQQAETSSAPAPEQVSVAALPDQQSTSTVGATIRKG